MHFEFKCFQSKETVVYSPLLDKVKSAIPLVKELATSITKVFSYKLYSRTPLTRTLVVRIGLTFRVNIFLL